MLVIKKLSKTRVSIQHNASLYSALFVEQHSFLKLFYCVWEIVRATAALIISEFNI